MCVILTVDLGKEETVITENYVKKKLGEEEQVWFSKTQGWGRE